MIKVKLLGDSNTPAYQASLSLFRRLGFIALESDVNSADVAVAPLLTEILKGESLNAPRLGTLIFHPSPLPYGRGKASIKYAYKRKEPLTAATWFWANTRLDAGDICEQEIIKMNHELRPRDFYQNEVIPAMLRTLERAMLSIAAGVVRRVPQVEDYSSYD